jgi:hypothetical protein
MSTLSYRGAKTQVGAAKLCCASLSLLIIPHTPSRSSEQSGPRQRRRDLQVFQFNSTSNGAFPPVAWVASLTCSTFQMAPDSDSERLCRPHPTFVDPVHLHPSRRAQQPVHCQPLPLHRSHHLSESLQWQPIDLFAKGAWAMVPWSC